MAWRTGDLFRRYPRHTGEEARQFRLVQRINPQGSNIQPYWIVVSEGTGEASTIREDRLSKGYTFLGRQQDGPTPTEN